MGVKPIAAGQPGRDQVAHQALGRLAVRFQKKEVVRAGPLLQRFAIHDVMGIFHDQAALCLAEDLVQADRRDQPGTDGLPQNIARPYTGQLIRIAHHDDPAAVPQRCEQRLKQLYIHHTHLIQDDHVTRKLVFVVMDKAHHPAGVIHLQQAMDGAGLAPGQLTEALGGRPVGAHSATRSACCSSSCKMALTVVVLPVPGPPVSTRQFSVIAIRMASF